MEKFDMLQLNRIRTWLLLIVLLNTISVSNAYAESLYGTAADPFEADRVGLTREWIVQLPFDSDRYRLNQIDVGRWMVVAQSEDGLVHAVRSGSGEAQDSYGPAAAARWAAEQLGWTWLNAVRLMDHTGEIIELLLRV